MSDGRFAGVDWASEEHAVCVVDERGRILEGRRYRHNEPGIRALCARLLRLGVALVALERPDGLLIERLLDAGLAVVAVHPNQVKAMRPRFSVAGGKSDGFDSFVLAELARTDSHRFRVLEPDSDQTKALRAMTRARDGLVRTRVGLANQLRDQLATFWPGASKVFCSVDSHDRAGVPASRYPTPLDARGLGEQRLQAFLKRHGYTGRKPARELLARLRDGAEGRAGELETAGPPTGRAGARLRAGADRRADQRADDRDPPRARGAPRRRRRSARCSSPQTRGCAPQRCSPRSATAASATPATARSPPTPAKPRRRRIRESPNTRSSAGPATTDYATAFCTLADSSRRHNPWAADIYNRARARGASHTHATRILGRAWSQIIWRLWHDHDTYDPHDTPPCNASSQPEVDTGGLGAAAEQPPSSGSLRHPRSWRCQRPDVRTAGRPTLGLKRWFPWR